MILNVLKQGGEHVKYWSYLSSSSVESLVFIGRSMKGKIYRDILQRNLVESVKNLNLDQGWIIRHDNDPKHRAHTVTKWLDEKGVERPSDLNPIEHIWKEIEVKEWHRISTSFATISIQQCNKEIGQPCSKSFKWDHSKERLSN